MRCLLFVILSFCISCTSISSSKEPTKSELAIEGKNWAFAIDYYLNSREDEQNLLFSPFSLGLTFAGLYLGAEDETAEEIGNIFYFTKEKAKLFKSYGAVARHLSDLDSIRLANSVWIQKSMVIKPSFLEGLQALPQYQFKEVDFEAESSEIYREINAWALEETQGKIRSLVSKGSIGSETRLVSANALTMNGEWTSAFSQNKTFKDSFFAYGDTLVNIPMMHQEGSFPYLRQDDFSMIELPYKDGRLGFYVILPRVIDGLFELEDSISIAEIQSWISQMKTTELSLSLPRFRIYSGGTVQGQLEKIGLTIPFSYQADFKGISETENLMLNSLFQSVMIDVNEAGTSAAVATAAVVGLKAKPPSAQQNEFKANHPFLFFVIDKKTQAILFMGRFEEPEEIANAQSFN